MCTQQHKNKRIQDTKKNNNTRHRNNWKNFKSKNNKVSTSGEFSTGFHPDTSSLDPLVGVGESRTSSMKIPTLDRWNMCTDGLVPRTTAKYNENNGTPKDGYLCTESRQPGQGERWMKNSWCRYPPPGQDGQDHR